jgi:hypothetical protein
MHKVCHCDSCIDVIDYLLNRCDPIFLVEVAEGDHTNHARSACNDNHNCIAIIKNKNYNAYCFFAY